MSILKIKLKTAVFFICYLSLLLIVYCEDEIKELTDDDYTEIRNLYRIEEKEEEKSYQEAALHPEKYDTNKDRKISRKELIKAITYLIFPKKKAIADTINKKVIEETRKRINNFANSHPEFLTYRQFSYVIITLKDNSIINPTYYDELVASDKAGLEHENDL